jgi:hypothetical protein
LEVPAGGSKVVRLRLSAKPSAEPFDKFDEIFAARLSEADDFYNRITPPSLSEDERRVHRQALAGMLWTKQYYYFDLDKWLDEHQAHPLLGTGNRNVRNTEWFHMLHSDIISMPEKWEYPCYAAWDLTFHTWRCRSLTSISPRTNSYLCCGACMPIQMGSFRPMSGTSAM